MSVSVFVSAYLSACLFVCLCLFVFLPTCLPACLFVCLFARLSVCLSFCQSVRLPVFRAQPLLTHCRNTREKEDDAQLGVHGSEAQGYDT